MLKAMWIAVLAYFGLIFIAAPVVANDSINWVDVDPADWCGAMNQDDREWLEFEIDAYNEYADEFTAMFNAVEYKLSKNGRSMTRSTNGGGFKFI